MQRWKVLVVEDEHITREHISKLVEQDENLELVGALVSIQEAREVISQVSPDLLLLDIQLSDGTSFEILENLSKDRPQIIFITAYHEFAIKAFEEHAIDYLLKPFDQERFQSALDRAKSRLSSDIKSDAFNKLSQLFDSAIGENPDQRADSAEVQDHITIKVDGRTLIWPTSKIQHIEADKSGVSIHIDGNAYLKRDSLSHMEQVLDPKDFIRIHRSTIVNLSEIAEIQPWFHGDYVVIMKDEARLKLSRRYKSSLEERLGSKI